MKLKLWGLTALTIVALTGCTAAPAADPSPTPTELGEVDSVVALRDAFVDAGGSCPQWERDDVVTNAAQSGACSDSTVLMMFVTNADLANTVDTMRDFRLPGNQLTLLVGPNWIINSPEAEDMADTLGGEWVKE